MEGKRNQRYFIEGQGEADEVKSQTLDVYRAGYMSALEKNEGFLEKTAEENELLEWIFIEAEKIAKRFNIEAFKYQPEHVHVGEDEIIAELKQKISSGFTMSASMLGIVSGESEFRSDNKLEVALILAHEAFHMLGMSKYRFKTTDGSLKMQKMYRSGVYIAHGSNSLEKQAEAIQVHHFNGLNEAITQELTRYFYLDVVRNNDRFKNEVEEWDANGNDNNKKFPKFLMRTYGWLTTLFLDLCEEIKSRQPEKFRDMKDVEEEFFKIYFNGEIKDLKSLLDGIGSSAFADLSAIGSRDSEVELKKIKDFREKYQLRPDEILNKIILKKQSDKGKKDVMEANK